MNILITGGAGYLGSTLAAALLDGGHRVRVLDSLLHGGESLLSIWCRPFFEFCRGDIRDASAVQDAMRGMDAVVHLAAIVGDPACARQPDVARAVNLDASAGLLNASQRAGVARFVFASTCSNYGKMADSEAYVDERSELRPVSLYAETKVAVERMVLAQARPGFCATALRFATLFGVSPRMRFDLTVNEFALEMLARRRLTVYGDQFWRPYVHVRDAARAIALVLEANAAKVSGEVFNVGATGENYRKRDIVQLIQQYVPDAEIVAVEKHEDPRDYRVSFEKIASTLCYAVEYPLRSSLPELVHLVKSGVIADVDSTRYRN